MNNKGYIAVLFLMTCLITACSTKKDAFLNRKYHALSTKYNVLFNGNEALRNGLEELNANYEDNYWEVLPIEPLKVEKLGLPGMNDEDVSNSAFEKAEEKAVKAVQKHSMVIARQERNSQIDDAYLLLGKARYYSKRFVPSLEAFNYVIINYPGANLIQDAKIWQAKTLIRLQNEEQAIENLNALLKGSDLEDETIENAQTALAMAYESLGQQESVIEHLIKAVESSINAEQTSRNLFILGQHFSRKSEFADSNSYFQKIIDLKKAPFKYKIHAYLEKAKNASNAEEIQLAKEELTALAKDRDNRSVLDELYYQLGKIEQTNSKEQALEYFNKSLRASLGNTIQRELSYEAIGNLYFDNAEFLKAGSYYDSILSIANDKNSKRVRRLTRKRSNLNEVILYETLAKRNDSILNLVAMTDDERITYFSNHIENLKIAEKLQQQKPRKNSGLFSFGRNTMNSENGSGKWYFYNVQTVGFGSQEFERIWGNRPLEDNWRLSNKTMISFGNENGLTETEEEFDTSKKYELDYYTDRIPTDVELIAELKSERNDAYYKLGLIYKEQFAEIDLAEKKLTKLLAMNPSENLKIPATYHMFKIYEELENPKASVLREEIVTKYKDSKYAQILLNPSEFIANASENSPEKEYASVFYAYKSELFDEVIEKCNLSIVKFEGQTIVAKFELLKAYAIGQRDGIAAFKEALDFVAMNYPNTEEGAKAIEVIETIKSKL